MDKLNIASIAKGALVEQAEGEIQRVLDNIADPNTDSKKARKVTITLTFKPANREAASVDIQTKSSIVPYNAVTTQIYMGVGNDGKVVAAEYEKGTIPGQEKIVDTETGEIVRDKVVNMKGR